MTKCEAEIMKISYDATLRREVTTHNKYFYIFINKESPKETLK